MVDINKKYLSDDDYNELISEYHKGSKEAYRVILDKSLILIDDTIRNNIDNASYDYELLRKIGEFALIDAIKSYKPNTSYKSYVKMCILYKIRGHLEKNPNPSISLDNTILFENINKELKLGITEKAYLDIRAIIELQSARVKMIIKLRYGYNGKCMSLEEIVRKYNYNADAVKNTINNFNNILTKRYLGIEYKHAVFEIKEETKIDLKSSIYEYFPEYSKEEVKYAVGILPNSQRNIIYLKYGSDLSENNNIDIVSNNAIHNEIIDVIESILINYKKNKNKKSLYEYFLEYPKGDVKYAVMHLPKRESHLIYKRFGYDLNTFNFISSDDIEKINSVIIPHIRTLLKEIKIQNQVKSLFDYFRESSEETIIFAISKLGEKQKRIIFNRFGRNLESNNTIDKNDLKLLEDVIIPRLSEILNEKHTLFDINDITKDRLKDALKELSKEEQLLFYRKFIKKESLTRSELITLYVNALPKFNRALRFNDKKDINEENKETPKKQVKSASSGKERNKTLFERLPGYSEKQIRDAVSKLCSKHQNAIYKRYGVNLDELNDSTKKENTYLASVVVPRLKEILEGKINRIKIGELLSDYSLEEIKNGVSELSVEEQAIVYKKYGINLDEYNKLSRAENNSFYGSILPKIRRLLKCKKLYSKYNSQTIYELLGNHSKEEILLAVNNLTNYQKKIFFKRYGITLDESNVLSTKESNILYDIIIPKMQRILNKENIENSTKKFKSITSYIEGYTLEEIKNAISKLSLKQQQIIYKRFGANLDEYNYILRNEYNLFYLTIKKLVAILNGKTIETRWKSLIDKLDSYSYEEIDKVVKSLSLEEQALIYKKYGVKLDEYHSLTKSEDNSLRSIVNKINKKLLNGDSIEKPKSKRIKYNTIFDRFSGFTKEEVINAINSLSLEEQSLIYKKYGQNLDEYHFLNKEDSAKFYSNVLYRIKDALNKNSNVSKRGKTIYEYLSGYSKDAILEAISSLDIKYQTVVFKRYGKELDQLYRLESKEINCLHKIIIPRLKKALNGEIVTKRRNKTILEYFEGHTLEEIKNAINKLKPSYQAIVYKRYGVNLDELNYLEDNERTIFYNIISPKIKSVLNGEKLNTDKRFKPLLSYYDGVTKEDLIRAINGLDKKYQDLIHKKYGLSLDEQNSVSRNENATIRQTVIPTLRKVLNGEELNIDKRLKSLLSYFDGVTKEDLIRAINDLDKKYQDLIYKKYGHNLDEHNPVSRNENAIIRLTIIPNLRNVLRGEELKHGKEFKPLLSYYDGVTKEDLIKAITSLKSKYQDMIYKRYGYNLDEHNPVSSNEKATIRQTIIPKLRNMLNGEELNTYKKCKPLLSYFDGVTREDLIQAINDLDKKYQDLIHKKYGLNLDEQNLVSPNETAAIRQTIIPKLRKMLNGEVIKAVSFYELVGLSKEDTLKSVEFLSKEEREDLFKYYGYDLDNIKYISSDPLLKERVETIIIPKLKQMDVSKVEVFNIDTLTPIISNILKEVPNVSKLDIVIFILRIGLEANGPYDMDMMSEYFKLSPRDINAITLKVLGELSINLDTVYDKIAKGLSKPDEIKPLMINPIEGDKK